MKRNLFLGVCAATGMLLATSCSNDELALSQSGGEAQVSFALGLQNGLATRAISDGKSVDKLVYAVFDSKGNRISTIDAVTLEGVTFPTTANITLAKGQTYKVAFWAQDADCKAYTVDTDNMSVSINYANENNKANNDETRDAFFKTVEFTVTGSTSIDVEMKRPFAQLNVGVTKEDREAAVASGIEISQSAVVIENAANQLNLLDGSVSGSEKVNYVLGDIPAAEEKLKVDADKDGTAEEYHWLSMSYILPSAEPADAKAVLDKTSFEFVPSNAAYQSIKLEQGLTNVPVQRNWRTNILGKLLTGDITFNIVVDPAYEDDENIKVPYATINGVRYNSFDEAMAAVKTGETITLQGETTPDATANQMMYVINDKNITIDLNGYGFVANIPDVTKNTAIFQVKKGAGLTIQGQGNVKVVTGKCGNNLAAMVSNEGGTVNLNGGNWTMTALDYPDALIPTFVDNNSTLGASTLNINDGTYTFHRNLFRNFSNHQKEVATININGGTFNGRQGDSGAIWNQKPNDNTPEGAGVINLNGGVFNNVEITDDFAENKYKQVSSAEQLQQVLDDATADVSIMFTNDITGDVKITQKANVNVEIFGNQKKFTGLLTTFGNGNQAGEETLTINGIHFVANSGADACIVSPSKGSGSYSYSHNVTVENCTFTDPDKEVGCAAIRQRQGGDKNWTVKNCKVDDTMHSLLQVSNVAGKLTVEGCEAASKNGANLNSCTNVEINNCKFNTKGYCVRFGVSSGGEATATKTFLFKNSTLTSAGDEGDAAIILRSSAANATLTFENTTVNAAEGNEKISGVTDQTTIEGTY